jgi:hypothetical protein
LSCWPSVDLVLILGEGTAVSIFPLEYVFSWASIIALFRHTGNSHAGGRVEPATKELNPPFKKVEETSPQNMRGLGPWKRWGWPARPRWGRRARLSYRSAAGATVPDRTLCGAPNSGPVAVGSLSNSCSFLGPAAGSGVVASIGSETGGWR